MNWGKVFFLILFYSNVIFANNQENTDYILFKSFADTIKSRFQVKVFYDPLIYDTLRVKYYREGKTLSEVLKNSKPELNYIFDGNKMVFTLNKKILEPIDDFYKVAYSSKGLSSTQKDSQSADIQEVHNPISSHDNLVQIGSPGKQSESAKATISGYIKEKETGESVFGVVVSFDDLKTAVSTDMSGYYVVTVPKGRHKVSFKSFGKSDVNLELLVFSNGQYNLEMEEKLIQLKDVVIVSKKNQNVMGIQIGLEKMDIATIKQIPSAMGEVDIMQAALLLPGVQTVGEGASGFNVRGGNTDQNLILINNAPVFNPSHMFGFFSAFNPDIIKDFELFKSGIPAKYGGRASSIFDITSRNGNSKKLSGSGGIGLITGKLTIEAPIVKDKASFIIGLRATYSDWLLKQFDSPSLRNSSASFHDINSKFNYDINKNNTINISAYYSSDYFKLRFDTSYQYSNSNYCIAWKHLFNDKLIGNFNLIGSNYQYSVSSGADSLYAFRQKYWIGYLETKADFNFYPSSNHSIGFGINMIRYSLKPGMLEPGHSGSIVRKFGLEQERALESAVYIGDEWSVNPKLLVYGGIRFSTFWNLGPQDVYIYTPNNPIDTLLITGVKQYGANELVQFYFNFEPRLSLRYIINPVTSFKFSYNRMAQYLHMLSNSIAISPTDIWKLSDPYIPPQVSDQLALGLFRDLKSRNLEASLEVYYKWNHQIVDYKGGAKITLNDHIETDLINALGNSYGIEFMIKKKTGKLNGWLAYTYSRSLIKADGKFISEKINGGEFFPANFDKPHDVSFVSNYKFSRRLNVSGTFLYSTGRPITYPVARYTLNNSSYLYYSKRNEYRLSDYIRWDLSITLDGNLRSKKLAHSSWTLAVFNVAGRNNVYSVYFISSGSKVKGYQLSVFAEPITTLTYNFKF